MEELLDPKYDTGFKLIFGREDVSEDILREFLNSLFENDPELSDIKSVVYMNTEKTGNYSGAKGIRYDILCETGSGHRFIVEMQKSWQRYFLKRAEYYYARAVSEQGYRGKNRDAIEWDYNFVPVVGVYICQSRIKGLPEKAITRCRLVDEENMQPIDSSLRFVYIQLPFFEMEEAECKNYSDQWIYNIKNMGSKQSVAFKSHRDIFRRLAEIGKVSMLSPEERRSYEADVKNARDYRNELEGARIEGHEQGLEEGRAEGRAEGALQKLREIVKNLRSKGLDNISIAELLGESDEFIASII